MDVHMVTQPKGGKSAHTAGCTLLYCVRDDTHSSVAIPATSRQAEKEGRDNNEARMDHLIAWAMASSPCTSFWLLRFRTRCCDTACSISSTTVAPLPPLPPCLHAPSQAKGGRRVKGTPKDFSVSSAHGYHAFALLRIVRKSHTPCHSRTQKALLFPTSPLTAGRNFFSCAALSVLPTTPWGGGENHQQRN